LERRQRSGTVPSTNGGYPPAQNNPAARKPSIHSGAICVPLTELVVVAG
jgi:hypothetical protein